MKKLRWAGYSLVALGLLLGLGSVITMMKSMATGLNTWLWYQTPTTNLGIALALVASGVLITWLSTKFNN